MRTCDIKVGTRISGQYFVIPFTGIVTVAQWMTVNVREGDRAFSVHLDEPITLFESERTDIWLSFMMTNGQHRMLPTDDYVDTYIDLKGSPK